MRAFFAAFALAMTVSGGAFADAASDCHQRNDQDLSIRSCTLIIEGPVNGDKAKAYLWRGNAYFKMGEHDLAIADYDQAIRLDPKDAAAYNQRGLAYKKKGEFDRAIADYGQSIRLNPNAPAVYNNRGTAYNSKGEYDRAIADLDQAVRLDPKHAGAYCERGDAYSRKGEYDRAIADYDQAIRLDPNHAAAYNNRGTAYSRKGDYDRAIADLDKVIRLDPKSAIAYDNRGDAYEGKGEHDRAIADYDQAIRLGPEATGTYNARGLAYSRKGEYDRAIADLDQAIRLDPKNEPAYNNKCLTYSSKGEYDRAIADCDQAIRLDPKRANPYNHRGWAFYKKGDNGRAIADINEAVRLNPKYTSARERRGHVLLAQGNANAGLEDFNEALRLKADSVGALWGRGQVYETKGLRSLALGDYKRAIELKAADPDDTDAQNKALARLAALEAVPSASAPVLPQQSAPPAVAAKPQIQMGRRVALVIGNSNYAAVGKLTNPANDARAIAATLRRIGFAEVIERYNLDLDAMVAALKEFGEKTLDADWAVVYYAGHGIEMNGVPYLIPVDAKLQRDTHVADEAVSLERVLSRVETARKLRLVILDACRNNPFAARMVRTAGLNRAIGRGLAPLEPEGGVLVAYSAKHGTEAQDGSGANSPFASALSAYLEEPGLEINFLFRKVRDKVMSQTGGTQEPFLYGSLGAEPLYFAR